MRFSPVMIRSIRPTLALAAVVAVAPCLASSAVPIAGFETQAESMAALQATAETGEAAPLSRRVTIMDFSHVAAPATVMFRYTPLVAGAAGQAGIEPFKSVLRINAVFTNLPPASRLGAQYLTYTLWEVTPEGRTTNLGEVELTGSGGAIRTKSKSRRFGLIVTAEPYFAVSSPSSAVAFEADLSPGNTVNIPLTQATCHLLRTPVGALSAPDVAVSKTPAEPLLFEEARRALAAARAAGAAEYAPQTFDTAAQTLQIACKMLAQGAKTSDVHDAALEAVLIAEDARVLAVARQRRAQPEPAAQDPAH
jgi:hypothetical protein